jgi:hypothetical protein
MSTDVLAAEERLVLIQLRWGTMAQPGPDDETICRRLEAQGLITKVAHGGWDVTSLGKSIATPGQ